MAFRAGTVAVIVILATTGCGVPGPNVYQQSETITLPSEIGSFELAQRIGTHVSQKMTPIFESNPDLYDPEKVGFGIKWGETKDLSSGESVYYVRVVINSVTPIQQGNPILDLMRRTVQAVQRTVDEYADAHQPAQSESDA